MSKNASSASNASRAVAGVRAAPCHANGDDEMTAWRKRSGVVAQRSTSMYCAAAAGALANPLQQPGPSSAAAPQNHRDSRRRRLDGALYTTLEPSLWTRHSAHPAFQSAVSYGLPRASDASPHAPPVPARGRIGIRTPRVSAVATAAA